ncbi:MAG: flagellar biosynthetic protein FliO [Acidimicrobiia bacterium]
MSDASVIGLLARLVVSLAVVLGLMVGAAALLRRRGGSFARSKGSVTEVLARQSLSRTASVQVVRIGDRALVLGVTEQQVTYLSEADAEEFHTPVTIDVRNAARARDNDDGSGADWTVLPGNATRSGQPRTTFLEALRERTTRR